MRNKEKQWNHCGETFQRNKSVFYEAGSQTPNERGGGVLRLDDKSVHVTNHAKISCQCGRKAAGILQLLCCSRPAAPSYIRFKRSTSLTAIPGPGKYCCLAKDGKQTENKLMFFPTCWSKKQGEAANTPQMGRIHVK